MAKDEKITYDIQNDAGLGDVKIADEVVAIIAGNNPFYVPFAALFLSYLRVGALQTARMGSVPNELIYVIQAVMIILFGAKTFGDMLKRRGGKKV